MPAVSICVLTYGEHAPLVRRAVDSIVRHCPRPEYELIVGANAPGKETIVCLQMMREIGAIDSLINSPVNLNKCPMMRQMFARVTAEFIWWFDDDSYIVDASALPTWLEIARKSPASTVMWGQTAQCDHPHN